MVNSINYWLLMGIWEEQISMFHGKMLIKQQNLKNKQNAYVVNYILTKLKSNKELPYCFLIYIKI